MKNKKRVKGIFFTVSIVSLAISIISLSAIYSRYRVNDGLWTSYMHKEKNILEEEFYKSNLFEYNTLRPIVSWLGESVGDNDEFINNYIKSNTEEEYDYENNEYKLRKPSKETAEKFAEKNKSTAREKLSKLQNIIFWVENTKTNEYYTNTKYKSLEEYKSNVDGYLDIVVDKTDRSRNYTKEMNKNKIYTSDYTVETELLNAIDGENIKIYASFFGSSNVKPTPYFGADRISENYIKYYEAVKSVKLYIIIFIVNLTISIMSIILYKKMPIDLFDENSRLINLYKKIPIEVIFIAVLVMISIVIGNTKSLAYFPNERNYRIDKIIIFTNSFILSIIYISSIYFSIKRYRIYNSKEYLLKSSMIVSVYLSFKENMKVLKKSFKDVPLIKRIVIIAIILLSINIIGWLLGFEFAMLISSISIIIFTLYIMKILSYSNEIIEGTNKIKNGDLHYKIPIKGNDNFTELAKNINNIGEGLENSIEKQLKDERLKSELITNVSHDLKTPLTSIINYIQIIKREQDNIYPEHIRDYINILDSKSKRLKILIEDLFEASKTSSGNIELDMKNIDIKQLLRQSIGEISESIDKNNLTIKLSIPEEKIYIYADGKRMYRVLENLLTNISKYSMKNTRVYIDLYEEDKNIILSMKNISSYELNFDPSEIIERFKRADESRNSEGSGLGLAIAKDLINLQGGEFKIDIDGDLFKVTLKFKKIESNN